MEKAQDVKTNKWRFKSWLSVYHFCKLGKVTYPFPDPISSSVMRMTMATHRLLVRIKYILLFGGRGFFLGKAFWGRKWTSESITWAVIDSTKASSKVMLCFS